VSALDRLADLFELGQILRARALRHAPGNVTGDHPAELVVILDRLAIEAVDEGTPMWLDPHEALALEGYDSLAHGNPTHTERLGDLLLRDAIAAAELAVEDELPNVIGHGAARTLAREAH
jgi:hypothetical protein